MNDEKRGNPYIHDDPIKDPDIFAGRDYELEQLEYILGLATRDPPQYKNIGITGKEGSGKSSMTFMIEDLAREKDILPIRMTLDDSDVEKQQIFFKQLIDEITDGIGGTTRDSFLQLLSGVNLDEVELNLQFFKVALSGSDDEEVEIFDSVLRNDFSELVEKADKDAICLIIDNSQILANNPIILQKFKNVFSEIEGYLLVLSGTEETFSEIESAFSPLARTFERFQIGPFESIQDTLECLRNPLSGEEAELLTDQTVNDIHRVSGGRPYEINLMAYHMFAEYQKANLERLELTSEVIDQVAGQLDVWRRSINNERLELIQDLGEIEIQALLASLEFPNVEKYQLLNYCSLYYFTQREGTYVDSFKEYISEISEVIDELVEEGLINLNSGKYEFAGDVYSAGYLKYYSHKRGVVSKLRQPLSNSLPNLIGSIHHRLIDDFIISNYDQCHSHFLVDGLEEYGGEMLSVVDLESKHYGEIEEYSLGDVPLEIYKTSKSRNPFSEKNYTDDEVLTFRVNINWLDTGYRGVIHLDNVGIREEVSNDLENLAEEVKPADLELILEDEMVLQDKASEYIDEEKLEEANETIEAALELNPEYLPALLTKARYHWSKGEIDEAIQSIDEAIEKDENYISAWYYRARIMAASEEHEKVIDSIERGLEPANSYSEAYAEAACIAQKANLVEKVETYASKALEIDQENWHAVSHLANAKHSSEEYEEVIDLTDGLPEKENDNIASCYMIRGVAFSEMIDGPDDEKLDHALESLSTADSLLSEESKNLNAHIKYNLACVNSLARDAESAIPALEEAIQEDPSLKVKAENDSQFDPLREEEIFQELIEES